MNSLCNVGLCFNPSLNRAALSGPPRARRLARLSLCRLARLTRQRLRRPHSASLVPSHRKRQTHSLNGFSSRVCFAKRFTPFSGESPASPRFPLGLRRGAPWPHPFSPKLSRFRARSFVAAETAPAPCVSQVQWGVGFTPEAHPSQPEPGFLPCDPPGGNQTVRRAKSFAHATPG